MVDVIVFFVVLVKKVKLLVYKFIWNGLDKIFRKVIVKLISEGGLGVFEVDSLILAVVSRWFKRASEFEVFWKDFLDWDLV